jgi:aminopeptidase C
MLCYSRNLLAILLLLNVCSCKPKPKVQKEVVYKDYSLKQLKKYLAGTWVRIDNVTKDTLTKPFRFIYKSKSETSGYMKPLIIEDFHFTFFDVDKDKTGCSILFTPFMPKPDRKFHKIKKISNLGLIIEDDEGVLTYNKVLEN